MENMVDMKDTPSVAPSGLAVRLANERGMADHGWLKSAHSFSFANYYDPKHMGFQNLRVINDDYIAPSNGFPTHPHQNAEIFSYVLEGALEHADTMGNGSVVKGGGVQYMSAGAGVRHSEYNPSPDNLVHLLQIWLLPNVEGGEPRYETMDIDPSEKDGQFKLFLSHDGRDGSIAMKADADIYAATLDGDQQISAIVPARHKGWVQVARGEVEVNGIALKQGDALIVKESGRLDFKNGQDAEVLFFDLFDRVSM